MAQRFDPPSLYEALDAERVRRGASWSQVAQECGVASATVRRLRQHGRFEVDGVLAVVGWLGRPLEDFTTPAGPTPAGSPVISRPRTIPLLPCADIDEIEPFFTALGFRTTYRQVRPNPMLGINGHGFDLQYYALEGHTPESSHSTCLVIVGDTGAIWEEFATGLREAYGKLPVLGFPRITRPRARKNADGVSGFSLVDPAGNWLRFYRGGGAEPSPAKTSRLGDAVQNAVVLADSKGDVAQAAKILRGAIDRAPADDPAHAEAQSFMDELSERLS